ncbi:amino acid permease [Mycolicibacterium sp. P1-18]|uniref:APC family permease n=1 Tax=Mycolicibacterium sp. P1-18 TaxID=2024615 RepID=UPI0011F3E3FC|nr:APC family permease [Mycolicibacterium sp. P1-18]KAA0098595.1 amino acid permease [Mycolicibacterium sp. P1-18]
MSTTDDSPSSAQQAPRTRAHSTFSDSANSDDAHLMAIGYKPQLDRSLSWFSNFALGFLYLSPMVGVISIFAMGIAAAGGAAIWWIPIVGVGMLLIALVFGEVVSQYPIAGGIYQWSRRLWSGQYAWLMSWIYVGSITMGITTTALFSSDFVASLFLGTADEPSVSASPLQKLIITIAVLGFCLALNLRGTRALGVITKIGLVAELSGVVGVGIYLLLFERTNSFDIFFTTMGRSSEHGLLYAMLAASLVGLYLFGAIESCGELAEETPNPARAIPRAMILTVIVGGLAAMTAFAGFALATPNLEDVVSGSETNPIPTMLQATLGTFGSKVFLLVAVTSFIAGVMGQQTAVSRFVFSLARDGMFPGSHVISKTAKKHPTPVNALLITNVLPVLVVIFIYFSPDSLFRLAGFQVIAIYAAFGMVVAAALRARVKGWRPAGPWNLGRFGLPVTVAALLYCMIAIVILARPGDQDSFFDRWIGLIGFGIVLVTGLAYLFIAKPERKSNAPEGDAIEIANMMREREAL